MSLIRLRITSLKLKGDNIVVGKPLNQTILCKIKMKKFLKLLVAAIMIITSTMATACGDDEQAQELITIEVYSQLANSDGAQSGFFSTLLEDKFGVKLVIVKDAAGVYNSRMEAQDLGDIVVWSNNGVQYQDAVKQGLLFAFEDEDLLNNYGKDIKQYFNLALETNRGITNSIEDIPEKYSNKIYGVGNKLCQSANDFESFFYTWDIRWDLYKQLGYPEINNLQDYADLLYNMKQLEPTGEDGNEMYAFSLWKDWDDKMVMNIKAFATAYYGYDELGIGLIDTETNRYYGALEEGGPYLTILKFFNDLYRRGLIDPDSMTQTFSEVSTKVQNGRNLASIFNFTGYMVYNSDERMENGKMMASLMPNQGRNIAYGLNPYGGANIWSIGSKTRYPEKCMEILNWLATPEGSMTMYHGLENVHWKYRADGGIEYTPFGKTSIQDKETLQDGVQWTSPYTGKTYTLSGKFSDGELQINNTFWVRDAVNVDPKAGGERFNEETWDSYQSISGYDIAEDWISVTGSKNRQEYMQNRTVEGFDSPYIIVPASDYAESRKSADLLKKWNQVIDCIKSYSWKAIYATNDNAYNLLIEQMIKNCNNYGYAECLAWSEGEAAKKFPA